MISINEKLKSLINSLFIRIDFKTNNQNGTPENMFAVLLYSNGENYSLEVTSMLRVIENNKIILTSADEFFDLNYEQSSLSYSNLLVNKNIKLVNEKLKNETIQAIKVNKIGDLTICFSNNILLEIRIDCSFNNYLYYSIRNVTKNVILLDTVFKNGSVCFIDAYNSIQKNK